MEFGMPTLIENRSLEENIALCKELDLKFIELNMNLPDFNKSISEAYMHTVKRTIKVASKSGIHILNMHMNILQSKCCWKAGSLP